MSIALILQLAALGLIVAMLPLSLVWAAGDNARFRKLIAVTLFLTFDLIVFGAFTRLTDSGLGCPDWPGCYGQANPFQADAAIRAAEAAMPDGPVTVVKAWIEMIHRYLAMAVGVLIVSLMVLSWRQRWRSRSNRSASAVPAGLAPDAADRQRVSPWFATFLFGFVCLQGAFGAWTVTLKLQPIIVTIHLVLGMSLLGLLAWLRARHAAQPVADAATARLRWPAVAALLLLTMQIALGGWVSTNYAALACMDFPLCHGQWVPPMDYSHGFALWRQLGMTAAGDYLPFQALTAIHWTHRNFAFVVIAVVAWVALRALTIPSLRRHGLWLLGAIGFQFLTGVATIYLEWPLAIAVAHNAGAAVLVLLLVMLNYATFVAARSGATLPVPATGRAFSTP